MTFEYNFITFLLRQIDKSHSQVPQLLSGFPSQRLESLHAFTPMLFLNNYSYNYSFLQELKTAWEGVNDIIYNLYNIHWVPELPMKIINDPKQHRLCSNTSYPC